MAPIPYACYGTSATLAQKIDDELQPDFTLVHGCFSLDSATSELPDSFAGNFGNADKAQSKIGHNAKVSEGERLMPKALVIGGSVPDDHWDTLKTAITAKAPGTTLIAIRKQIMMDEGINPSMTEDEKAKIIAKIIKRKMSEKGVK